MTSAISELQQTERYHFLLLEFSGSFPPNGFSLPEEKEDLYPIRNENNDKEFSRLSELQFVIRSLYGTNVLAPIDKHPRAILDAGTGSGFTP